MKSKKPSHNKTPYDKLNNERIIWLPPPPTNEKTGQLPPQNMSQGSKALHDNIPNTSMAVDLPAMNTTTNPGNDSSPFPHQPLTDTQPVRVNVAAEQPAGQPSGILSNTMH